MWFLLFFLSTSIFAADPDLEAIRNLENELPVTNMDTSEEIIFRRAETRGYSSPHRLVSLNRILKSGTEYGYVEAGKFLVRIADNKAFRMTESFYGKFYRLQDEQGFKYIENKDGSCIYKVRTEAFVAITEEMNLYEAPHRYTPAPKITKTVMDKQLMLRPEVAFYAGLVKGRYMRDLFNDEKANQGITTQYGVLIASHWNLPIQAGLALNYEKTTYNLSGGGRIDYSAASFGPQIKSKNFDVWGEALRLQTQFRVSPFAKAYGQTSNGDVTFKFNATDVMLSLEHPIQNSWGEFVLGLFYQSQWLNIKEQPEIVKIKASNQTNNSFGLSFSQVF